MTVVKEPAVAVDGRISAFHKYFGHTVAVEPLNKLRAECVLHAMDRPKDLSASIKVNDIAQLGSKVLGCEAAMVNEMPILSGDNQVKTRLQPIHEQHD